MEAGGIESALQVEKSTIKPLDPPSFPTQNGDVSANPERLSKTLQQPGKPERFRSQAAPTSGAVVESWQGRRALRSLINVHPNKNAAAPSRLVRGSESSSKLATP
jgi:hypothetical protein